MVTEQKFGNDYFGNLVIDNYPNLKSIIIKRVSLQHLKSLNICNCKELKRIEIENGAFYFVKTMIVESII